MAFVDFLLLVESLVLVVPPSCRHLIALVCMMVLPSVAIMTVLGPLDKTSAGDRSGDFIVSFAAPVREATKPVKPISCMLDSGACTHLVSGQCDSIRAATNDT